MKKLIFGIALIIFVTAIYFFITDQDKDNQPNGPEIEIPDKNTHWHPRLTILINGKTVPIPNDIGSKTGRIVDTELSGMKMSPTHTHEDDGTIHIENLNPAQKPETLTLGYFFYVWDKSFSSNCLFDFCTTNGTLKMYVNGKENNEFENYIMRDGDEIVLEYKENNTS